MTFFKCVSHFLQITNINVYKFFISAGNQLTWAAELKNTACDTRFGEKFLFKSSKLVSDEEACKKSCDDVAACKSITFFTSGWCSHFSTECKERNTLTNAISIRLEAILNP